MRRLEEVGRTLRSRAARRRAGDAREWTRGRACARRHALQASWGRNAHVTLHASEGCLKGILISFSSGNDDEERKLDEQRRRKCAGRHGAARGPAWVISRPGRTPGLGGGGRRATGGRAQLSPLPRGGTLRIWRASICSFTETPSAQLRTFGHYEEEAHEILPPSLRGGTGAAAVTVSLYFFRRLCTSSCNRNNAVLSFAFCFL